MDSSNKLTAQQKANKRHEAKRASQPRYMLRMTEQEGQMLDELALKHGTKKAAIMAGLELLKPV